MIINPNFFITGRTTILRRPNVLQHQVSMLSFFLWWCAENDSDGVCGFSTEQMFQLWASHRYLLRCSIQLNRQRYICTSVNCRLICIFSFAEHYIYMATYAMETSLLWKPVQTTIKKSSKFTKKITHADDMMTHDLVKYLVQTRLRLWDIKITNF